MKRATVILALLLVAAPAWADAKSRVATELAEYVLQRFGRKAVLEGTEVLARKIETVAAKHGDEVFGAVRKLGPRALPLVEEAGAHGNQAAKLIAQHGDQGAWLVTRPGAMKLIATHGDQAAAVLVKHSGGIAEPVVEAFGAPAVRALEVTGARSGRRLAMMMADGELAKIGRTPEVLEVIAKYGEPAMEFIWNNKGALAVGATLVAFLANPQAFLDGAKSLTDTVVVNAVRPAIEEGAREVAHEVAAGTNWTLIFLIVIGAVVALAVARGYFQKQK